MPDNDSVGKKDHVESSINEKKGFSDGTADNFEKTLSAFELAISDLFVWYEGDPAGWRVRECYRDLFACMTPRQIKSFLREQLLVSAGENDTENPVIAMLKALFHPIWKVWRDENAAFRVLGHTARAALALSKESQKSINEQGKLSGPATDLFHLQLQAMAGSSSVLSTEDVRACWPRKSEERALLLNLLDLATANVKLVANKSGGGESFPDWVRRQFGARPKGLGVAEQVSSFQDMALDRYRQGDATALQAVAAYPDLFLDRHIKFFDASTAASLSNLAVLISDVPGVEVQCDRLFQAAVKLARNDSRIPFYYVEFLLDVLTDAARRERLPAGDDAIAQANAILDAIQDNDLEPKDRIYRDILIYRLKAKPDDTRESQMAGVWSLVKKHADVLVSGMREPASRLSDLLDAVVGKGGASLSAKEPLQGVIWAAQVKAGKPGWAVAAQIANDLVGESSDGANEEKVGLRMNAALVVDPDLLAAGEGARLAAIWSQTGALLFRLYRTAEKSRIALAFLACLAYGGGAQAFERMRQVWGRLGEAGDGWRTASGWVRLLDPPHEPLALAVMNESQRTESLGRVRDAVFLPDYPPIATPDALSKVMGWDKAIFPWADGKGFDKAADELLAVSNRDGH